MYITDENGICETQMYFNGSSFELECPHCFGKLYIYSNDNIVCEENPEHVFSLPMNRLGKFNGQ
jgi:hypothetical protein